MRAVFVAIGAAALVGVWIAEPGNRLACILVALALGIGLGVNLSILTESITRRLQERRIRRHVAHLIGPMPERMGIHQDGDGWYVLSDDGVVRLPPEFDPFAFSDPIQLVAYLRDFYSD